MNPLPGQPGNEHLPGWEKGDGAAKPQVNGVRQVVIPASVNSITIDGEPAVDKCSRAVANSQNGVDLAVDFAMEGD